MPTPAASVPSESDDTHTANGTQAPPSTMDAKQSNLHPSKPLNTLFSSLPTTIFSVMSQLAVAHNSVNLGQGFPDEEGPAEMKRLAGQTLFDHHNQYPSLLGVPELRQAVARHSERYTGVTVDWQTEALVTVGATEGIAAALLGLINPGDEVGQALFSRSLWSACRSFAGSRDKVHDLS